MTPVEFVSWAVFGFVGGLAVMLSAFVILAVIIRILYACGYKFKTTMFGGPR